MMGGGQRWEVARCVCFGLHAVCVQDLARGLHEKSRWTLKECLPGIMQWLLQT